MTAYSPTAWVNDVPPPLSAANLNKLTNELKSQALVKGISHTLPTWADGTAPALTDPIPLNEIERVLAAVASSVSLSYTGTNWGAGWSPARNATRLNAMEAQAAANRVKIDGAPSGLSVDRSTMLAVGGTILRNDDSVQSDPLAGLWGQLGAQDPSRHVWYPTGGDPRPRADGSAQAGAGYRELNVHVGDRWQSDTSLRCELGRNTTTPYYSATVGGGGVENTGSNVDGTFAVTDEGQHRIHFWSQRYHDNFGLALDNWKVIMQNKEEQPYAANGPVDSAPALEVDIWTNQVHLRSFWTEIWASTAAPAKNTWIRYALEGYYTKNSSQGWVRLYVDLDGDGDFLDPTEMSPQITVPTLATVTSKGSSPRNVGDTLPSHMRLGIYCHDNWGTQTMDVDNIQVVG